MHDTKFKLFSKKNFLSKNQIVSLEFIGRSGDQDVSRDIKDVNLNTNILGQNIAFHSKHSGAVISFKLFFFNGGHPITIFRFNVSILFSRRQSQ